MEPRIGEPEWPKVDLTPAASESRAELALLRRKHLELVNENRGLMAERNQLQQDVKRLEDWCTHRREEYNVLDEAHNALSVELSRARHEINLDKERIADLEDRLENARSHEESSSALEKLRRERDRYMQLNAEARDVLEHVMHGHLNLKPEFAFGQPADEADSQTDQFATVQVSVGPLHVTLTTSRA